MFKNSVFLKLKMKNEEFAGKIGIVVPHYRKCLIETKFASFAELRKVKSLLL